MTLSDINIKDHRVQKLLGGVVILLIIVIAWYSQVYVPNTKVIKEKRAQLEQLNLKLSSIKLSAAKLPELKKEVERLFIKYKLLEELLPTSRDVPEIINRLTISGRESNVTIRRIDVAPTETGEYYNTDSYKIETTSNYHELATFLSSIANLSFIVTAKNFNIKRNAKSVRATIDAVFTLQSYHIPSEARLERPTEISDITSPSSKGISKPQAEKPRATESDAVGAISGGLGPAPE